MITIILVVHVLVAMALVVLILIQRGKGAEIGASFGSGASQTLFGSQGSASFLTRTTAALAAVFFATSLSLAYLYSNRVERKSVTELVTPTPPVKAAVPAGQQGGGPAAPIDVPVVPAKPAKSSPGDKAGRP